MGEYILAGEGFLVEEVNHKINESMELQGRERKRVSEEGHGW